MPLPENRTAVGWIEQHVDDWIRSRIEGREWTPGPVPEHPRFIRKRDVLARVGLSYFTVWQLARQGRFPASVRLTEPLARHREGAAHAGL